MDRRRHRYRLVVGELDRRIDHDAAEVRTLRAGAATPLLGLAQQPDAARRLAEGWSRGPLERLLARQLLAELRPDLHVSGLDDNEVLRILVHAELPSRLHLHRARPTGQAAMAAQHEEPPPLQVALAPPGELDVVDLQLLCKHWVSVPFGSTNKQPRAFGKARVIDLVPDAASGTDKLRLLYRNDRVPPPDKLVLEPLGGAPSLGPKDAPKVGNRGSYVLYEPTVAYPKFGPVAGRDDSWVANFLRPAYWELLFSPQRYRLAGVTEPVEVHAYHPHKYKFLLSIPPFKSTKSGRKYEKQSAERVSASSGRRESARKVVETRTHETTRWGKRTKEQTEKLRTEYDLGGLTGSQREEKTDRSSKGKLSKEDTELIDAQDGLAIQLYQDGKELKIPLFDAVAPVVNTASKVYNVVDAIVEKAPKIGWYFDFELKLLAGALVAEWGWLEHHDHRAFLWVKLGAQIDIIGVTLELGIGISFASFKLQIYANVSGKLTLGAFSERIGPDAWRLAIPLTTTITGKIGARCEAGSWVKINGHGETSLVFELVFVWEIGQAMRLSGTSKWTGFVLKAEISVGQNGRWGKKTFIKTLVEERNLGGFDWPSTRKYAPARLSEDGVARVMTSMVSKGWIAEVDVLGGGQDGYWSHTRIGEALAERIYAHPFIKLDKNTMERLAAQLHPMLKEMEKDPWGVFRTAAIPGETFKAFLASRRFETILDTYVDPALEMQARAEAKEAAS